MNQAEALFHLQDLELNILRRQKRLAEIARILDDDHVVAAARARVTSLEQALAPVKTSARNLELEIQSNAQKAKATEDQLYSGRVRNPKELQDMEHEIAALKRRNGDLEERLLETMMAIDEQEAALAEARAALEQAQAARGGEMEQLIAEQAELQAQVARLKSQRENALKAVSAESLSRYNALKPKKSNQPVAALQGDSCSACGVQQTMAIVRQVQLGQSLVTCLSCGRILVYKGG